MYVFNVYLDSKLVHFNIPLRAKVLLGRDEVNTLKLTDPSVSTQHAVLDLREVDGKTTIVLCDKHGSNGTYVNEKRVEEQVVAPGDTVRLGRYSLEILAAHKKHLPKFGEAGEHQTVVFEGDPFTAKGSPASHLQAIYELSLSLTDLPVPILLERAAVALRRGLSFENICIMLEGSRGLVTCTSWNKEGPCGRSEIAVSRCLTDYCMRTGHAVISEDIRLDRRFADSESVKVQGVSSAMCLPLRNGDEKLGLIYCTSKDPHCRFSRKDLRFTTVVASQVAVAIGHQLDLTRLKTTAARLNTLIDTIKEGVLVCDRDFKILSTNQPARDLLHKESLEGELFQSVLSGVEHTFDPAAVAVRDTFEVIRKNPEQSSLVKGRVQSIRGHVCQLDHSHGQEWRYLICLLDDTQQRRAEQLKIIFVSQLAHKLRTPLTVFIGVVSLLEQHLGSDLDQELRWLLEKGEACCGEMRSLIDQFVAFSSVQLDNRNNFQDLPYHDLVTLVDRGLEVAALGEATQDLKIDNQIGDVGVELAVDDERVAYCIAQIVQNAGKFAGRPATLTIRCRKDWQGLRLRFIDDGPGIPRDELPKVLDLFHQVDAESTGQVPGCGLGLWWSLEIMRAHGGDVHIESPDPESGLGTRVEFAFPAERVRAIAPA